MTGRGQSGLIRQSPADLHCAVSRECDFHAGQLFV